ncbi:MAG: 50S ribosomal protein L4 [Ruminococcaceae bacterium]|nr:50S ribosomal protein L4 [Oscillospiraceae bacterium]
MPTVGLYKMDGSQAGTIELNENIFGQEINKSVLHQVVVNYLANQRQGTQSTKTRSEVSGGGIKPWRQKGTGRARQGSIRATQWIHGGIALGPKPRDYSYSLNKKVKKVAMKSALSSKVAEAEIKVIDELKLDAIKTKDIKTMLDKLEVNTKALIVTCEKDEIVYKSGRNIDGVTVTFAGVLNVYDILSHDQLIIAKDAIAKIEEVLA